MIIYEGKLSLAFIVDIAKRVHDSEEFTGFINPSETISANKIIYEGNFHWLFRQALQKGYMTVKNSLALQNPVKP